MADPARPRQPASRRRAAAAAAPLLWALAGACLCVAFWRSLWGALASPPAFVPPGAAQRPGLPRPVGLAAGVQAPTPTAAGRFAEQAPWRPGIRAVAAAIFVGVAATVRRRGGSAAPPGAAVARHATPQQIPVLDLEGKQIGEETLNFKTLSPETANYVVHHAIDVWMYMNMRDFTEFVPRRSDVKKGRKPWRQKGSGKARAGSLYSPLFGKSRTNKAPHGLDNKRKKKLGRHQHFMAISTVLQSKWKNMKIIQGLEDWTEPRQKKLEQCLSSWTDIPPGKKSSMIISRQGFGAVHPRLCVMTPESYESPLYLSGRLIPKLEMRRPRDIDADSDGLFQCLKGRRLFISREAFFDLNAKFNAEDGWAFKSERTILVEQMQHLQKEFPTDRAAEIEAARQMPRSCDEREFWAKGVREQRALQEAA